MISNFLSCLTDKTAKGFVSMQIFLSLLTLVSITGIVLESVPALTGHKFYFRLVEWVSVAIFSIEYVSRIAAAKQKRNYIFSFWGIVDLVSIIPAFLGLFKITSLSTAEGLRALNLIKIIRLGKISRAYWESQQNSNTEQRVNVTNTAIYFLSLFSSVIMTGALMHLTEGHQHVYSSIPLAMLQTAKILIGGITFAPATTLAGELSTLASRFLGLALFGLLVSVIGDSLRRMLFGKSVKSHGGATHKHPESHSSAENKRHDSSKPHA